MAVDVRNSAGKLVKVAARGRDAGRGGEPNGTEHILGGQRVEALAMLAGGGARCTVGS